MSGSSTSSVCKRVPMTRYAIPADNCRAGGILHRVPDGRPNRSPKDLNDRANLGLAKWSDWHCLRGRCEG